ncbi:MAG TPA: hypothetical protein VN577_20175 [Terriglobales bacterium]|nr:hypothetical protein [Clostridia bacterium]HWR17158.1 hypothetical protein [Terriglobales bacterium]
MISFAVQIPLPDGATGLVTADMIECAACGVARNVFVNQDGSSVCLGCNNEIKRIQRLFAFPRVDLILALRKFHTQGGND